VVTKKDKALAAAQKFLERGQQEKALAEFARVVQEDPKDVRTWLKMAEIYARRGANDQACDIYLRTGEIYEEQGFFQKAVAVYKNVIKLAPGLAVGHLRLGDVYRELGLVSDALQHLEIGATALQKAGRTAAALPALRQIVELHPENVVSRIKLAESASQAGAVDEAVREFASAAEQLKAQGRGDEYVRVAERLLFHRPESSAVARELAAVYIARGNPRLALAKLQAPLKAAPRDPENIELLARAMEAIDGPKAITVWKELAGIYDELGRTSERDAVVAAALAHSPSDPGLQELARRWEVSRAQPTAVETVGRSSPLASAQRSTSASAPHSPPPIPPAARAGFRAAPKPVVQGAPALARSGPGRRPSGSFSVLLTPRPDTDVARILSEAEVFVKYGLYQRAVDHLRRIFEHHPDHQAAREKLAGALAQLGRRAEAALELATVAESLAAAQPGAARAVAERALAMDGACERAARMLGREPAAPDSAARGDTTGVDVVTGVEVVVDVDRDPAADQLTPPPVVATAPPRGAGAAASAGPAVDLDAELEQVDFFLEQSMPDDARAQLDELRRRVGDHPRVVQKQREIEAALGTEVEEVEIEHTLPDRLGAVPSDGASDAGRAPGPGGGLPLALMADGGSADLSTHGDLGIAYKEMGLYDAAIAEFKQLTADPRREVFALTMVGECLEAKGTLTDAVVSYKDALNRSTATATETLVLYYQLGSVFERLGDQNEALYFFEKVAKRDARFREVDRKIAALKPQNLHA
jgi:tetratricopeptide (TPR) repeat protein